MTAPVPVGTQVPELLPEHGDGTIWADIQADLWWPHPILGWVASHHGPFSIAHAPASPTAIYGPYTAVVGPPAETTE